MSFPGVDDTSSSFAWTPYITTLLSLAGGLLIQRYLQKDTRNYERRAKRLDLLKTYYELQALKWRVDTEFDARAQAILEETRHFIETRLSEVRHLSNLVSFVIGALITFLPFRYCIVPTINRLTLPTLGQKLSDTGLQLQAIARLVLSLEIGFLVASLIGAGLANWFIERLFLRLTRSRRFKFLNWPRY
jgi:hypothetical protein